MGDGLKAAPETGAGSKLLNWLQTRWGDVRDLLHGLRVAWVPATSVLFGFLLYANVLEVQDLFLEGQGDWRLDLLYWGSFYLAVIFFWALPVFISARWILNRFEEGLKTHRHVRPIISWVRRYIPPLLVVSCFIGVFAGQFLAQIGSPDITDDSLAIMATEEKKAITKTKNKLEQDCQLHSGFRKAFCEFSFTNVIRQQGVRIAGTSDTVWLWANGLYAILFGILFWIFLRRSARRAANTDHMTRRALIWPVVAIFAIMTIAVALLPQTINIYLSLIVEMVGKFNGGLPLFARFREIIEFITIAIALIGGTTMLIGVPVLLWRGDRLGLDRLVSVFWRATLILTITPLFLFLLFQIVLFIYYTGASGLASGHLIILPPLTLLIVYLSWRGLRPMAGGRATRIGQILLKGADSESAEGETIATAKIVNPLFYTLLASTVILTFMFVLLHPIGISAYARRALLLPIILGLPIAMFTYLTHWSLRIRAPLVAVLVLVISVVGVLLTTTDPYDVRTIEDVKDRATLEQSITRWAKANNNCDLKTKGSCPPPIIVAASGGASRAAYFMADTLGKLMDRNERRNINNFKLKGYSTFVFSPDSQRVAVSSGKGMTALWDAGSGLPVKFLAGHRAILPRNVEFNADGSRLVTSRRMPQSEGEGTYGLNNIQPKLWDSASGRPIKILHGKKTNWDVAKFSPDGMRLITATYDQATLWDARTGKVIRVLNEHAPKKPSGSYDLSEVFFTRNGKRLITAGERVHIWDGETGALIARLQGTLKSAGDEIEMTGDVSRMITIDKNDKMILWDVQSGERIKTLGTKGRSAVFNVDRSRFITSKFDEDPQLLNGQTGELIKVLEGLEGKTNNVKFSPDGKRIVTQTYDKGHRLWNGDTGELIKVLTKKSGHSSKYSFSPDSKKIVTFSQGSKLHLWSADEGVLIKSLDIQGENHNSTLFSSDSHRFVTHDNKTAYLWNGKTGALIVANNIGVPVTFSPDNLRLVTISNQSTQLRHGKTGKLVSKFALKTSEISQAGFSPDSRRIITLPSYEGRARLWHGKTGAEIRSPVIRRHPFTKQLFAISAVSGGALGAAVTYAALADSQLKALADSQLKARAPNGFGKPPCKRGANDSDWFGTKSVGKTGTRNPQANWRDCLQLLLAGDFLSPVFISLVGNDALRMGFRGNRAEILEQAWEVRYARLTGQDPGLGLMRKTYPKDPGRRSTFARSMSELRKAVLAENDKNWLPILLLNGTSVATGRRIITSDIDILTRNERGKTTGRIFKDAYDLQELLSHSHRTINTEQLPGKKDKTGKKYDISLSTAATMSARFPLISPPGHIRVPQGGLADRVVDGGYFENFGVTTATELTAAIKKLALKKGWYLKPMIVLINNDPTGFNMECVEGADSDAPKSIAPSWFPSISAPFDALFRTQTSRGTHAAESLCNLLEDKDFAYVTVEQSDKVLPLSWWLSKNVQKKLDEDVDSAVNARAFLRINRARRMEGESDADMVQTPTTDPPITTAKPADAAP